MRAFGIGNVSQLHCLSRLARAWPWPAPDTSLTTARAAPPGHLWHLGHVEPRSRPCGRLANRRSRFTKNPIDLPRGRDCQTILLQKTRCPFGRRRQHVWAAFEMTANGGRCLRDPLQWQRYSGCGTVHAGFASTRMTVIAKDSYDTTENPRHCIFRRHENHEGAQRHVFKGKEFVARNLLQRKRHFAERTHAGYRLV